MTDISSLIERARQSYRLHDAGFVTLPDDVFHDLVAELSRLTVSSPSEETAGLLALMEGLPDGPWYFEDSGFLHASAAPTSDSLVADVLDMSFGPALAALPSLFAALQQQAREIERLNVIVENHGITQLEKTEIMLAQKARITELEAERDRLRDLVECKDCMEYAHRVAAGIKAKTIEECKQAIRGAPALDENGYICTKDAALKAIRALNQPEADGGD